MVGRRRQYGWPTDASADIRRLQHSGENDVLEAAEGTRRNTGVEERESLPAA